MKQLDLTSVPPEKRLDAIKDHLLRVQEETLVDPAQRAVIRAARKMHESELVSRSLGPKLIQ
jgi:hypothetical protein